MPAQHGHAHIPVFISIFAIHKKCGGFHDILRPQICGTKLRKNVVPNRFSLTLKSVWQFTVWCDGRLTADIDAAGGVCDLKRLNVSTESGCPIFCVNSFDRHGVTSQIRLARESKKGTHEVVGAIYKIVRRVAEISPAATH